MAVRRKPRTTVALTKAVSKHKTYHVKHVAGELSKLKKKGKIHYGGWEPFEGNRRSPRPVYAFGPGEDAPRPTPMPVAQRKRRYKLKHPDRIKASRRRTYLKHRSLTPFFMQLVGADKPRRPMADFDTPEPDDDDELLYAA
jgi:hypothetical protein